MNKSEDRIQQECVMWFRNTYTRIGQGIIFHVPNQNQQHLHGIGVLGGVSDLIVVIQGRVLFVEIKTESGTQSDAQKRFETNVNTLGHTYILIRSLDEFKSFILSHTQPTV